MLPSKLAIAISTAPIRNAEIVTASSGADVTSASSTFQSLFTPNDDPQHVAIDFKNAKVVDHSALAAIDSLAERYQSAGKKPHLKHLSQDCLEFVDKAKGMIEVNVIEDPKCHIADNKLGRQEQ